jgi:hypothetical protein
LLESREDFNEYNDKFLSYYFMNKKYLANNGEMLTEQMNLLINGNINYCILKKVY